jgi:hypothetical protein
LRITILLRFLLTPDPSPNLSRTEGREGEGRRMKIKVNVKFEIQSKQILSIWKSFHLATGQGNIKMKFKKKNLSI